MKLNRRIAYLVWGCGWALWLTLAIQPESRGMIRLGLLVLFAALLAGGLALFWRHRAVRYGFLVVAVLPLMVLALPGRAVDTAALRETYIASLAPYEGTVYSWGGENRVGIDCSGLVRRGFIVACMKEGLSTLNGRLVRKAWSLWWFDASAEAMRDGYRGETAEVLHVSAVNEMDHSRLLPGDMAVTENGVHIFVYIGDKRWMQADPGRGRAQYELVPVADSGWFSAPVRILRWTLLRAEEGSSG